MKVCPVTAKHCDYFSYQCDHNDMVVITHCHHSGNTDPHVEGNTISSHCPLVKSDEPEESYEPRNIVGVAAPQQLTVGTLREYFDDIEGRWTEQDTEYLGKFEHQKINVPCFSNPLKNGCIKYAGVGQSTIEYSGSMDFIIYQEDKE